MVEEVIITSAVYDVPADNYEELKGSVTNAAYLS